MSGWQYYPAFAYGEPKQMKNDKITIDCFGRLSIKVEGREMGSLMKSEKARELIAFLMTYEGCSVKKTIVCDALWGDHDPKHSADSLYKLVDKIYDMPIPFHLECRRNIIQLHLDNVNSDLTEFTRCIRDRENIKALESVIPLYQGTLFEEEGYEWIMDKEGKFDMLYLDALQYLADHYSKKGIKHKLFYYETLMERF